VEDRHSVGDLRECLLGFDQGRLIGDVDPRSFLADHINLIDPIINGASRLFYPFTLPLVCVPVQFAFPPSQVMSRHILIRIAQL
jgi:hypothetical protein